VGLICGLAFFAAGCPEDKPEGPKPLEGSTPGMQRYVVYFGSGGPDLTAYRAAVENEPEKVGELVDKMRAEAKAARMKFVQKLKAYDGRVVDYWWMSNAVTVEIPAGNAASLHVIEDVKRVEPDKLLP
jgi:hypothetical protein